MAGSLANTNSLRLDYRSSLPFDSAQGTSAEQSRQPDGQARPTRRVSNWEKADLSVSLYWHKRTDSAKGGGSQLGRGVDSTQNWSIQRMKVSVR